jgi:pyruvate formate lyase activating enzyme
LHPHDRPDIPEAEIWSFLEKRRGLLDGVVISGGEPTLQPDLLDFAARVHELGFLVKLDTNGCRPDVLQEILVASLADYVAMDIKAPSEKYALAAGIDLDVQLVQRSVDLLLENKCDYEFRTTVVPGILIKSDLVEIARWIAGARRYYLQQFVPRNTLDPAMLDLNPYLPAQIHEMADLARRYVDEVQVRGI